MDFLRGYQDWMAEVRTICHVFSATKGQTFHNYFVPIQKIAISSPALQLPLSHTFGAGSRFPDGGFSGQQSAVSKVFVFCVFR